MLPSDGYSQFTPAAQCNHNVIRATRNNRMEGPPNGNNTSTHSKLNVLLNVNIIDHVVVYIGLSLNEDYL